MITYVQKDKYTLHVTVPFDLKDEFKREFPGVRWNPATKKGDKGFWILLVNDTIRERLDTFVSTMERPSRLAAHKDLIEYTYADIHRLQYEADMKVRSLEQRLSELESFDAVSARYVEAEAQMEKVLTALEDKIAVFEKTVKQGQESQRKISRQVDRVLGVLQVPQDIAILKKTWAQYSGGMSYSTSAELKADFEEAQSSIAEAYAEIKANYGICLETLKDLSEIAWDDRAGLPPHQVERDMYRKVSFIVAPTQD